MLGPIGMARSEWCQYNRTVDRSAGQLLILGQEDGWELPPNIKRKSVADRQNATHGWKDTPR